MMRAFRDKLVYAVASLMLAFGIFAVYPLPKAQASTFDPSNLISDSVFENTASMTVPQLDAVANGYSASCVSANSGFTTGDPHGWSYTTHSYAFGGNVSIGQAVDSIALNYNVNPQVIYTTIQKEQSAITGSVGCHGDSPDAATQSQNSPCGSAKTPCTSACPYAGGCLPIIMSYGCPDYCTAADEGVSMQLTLGTWLLRFSEERAYGILTGYKGYESGDETFCYSGPMTPGWRVRTTTTGPGYKCGGIAGNTNAYYDGSWTTSDGTTVTITNGATASLYTYTPFVSGNQSFVNTFQNTFQFGSTLAGNCLGTESPLPYVQRFYNHKTYDHFYSAYACDTTFLQNLGYVNEGPVFNTSPSTASYAVPVHRYYNSTTQQHFWTTDDLTQAQLTSSGYKLEQSVVFYVATPGMAGTHQVYRYYNPKTYLHFWLADPTPTDNANLSTYGGYQLEPPGPYFNTQ